MASRPDSGLTLVEMLVVLVILALLATVAVTSTEGLVDQARFDSTQRGIQNIEESILGPHLLRQPDGSLLLSGFVVDMGRLPVFPCAAPAKPCLELLSSDRNVQTGWHPSSLPLDPLPPFAIQAPVGDPEILLPGGWRGPYLRLPPGSSTVADGWGHSYILRRPDDTALEPDCPGLIPLANLASLGADNTAGGTADYDRDLQLFIHHSVPPLQNRFQGDVAGRIIPSTDPGAGTQVVVRIYGPVDGMVKHIAPQQVFSASGGAQSFIFAAVPIGFRALRAYQVDTIPPGEDDPITPAVHHRTHRSAVVLRAVIQGGILAGDLQLEPASE